MLFNSLPFIAVFLPICLLLYWWANRYAAMLATLTLVVCSLVFYGWWKWEYLYLLLFSVLFNYTLGIRLQSRASASWLFAGVLINLSLLMYFKYTNLFLHTLSHFGWLEPTTLNIALPLAVSFFTFQQIAYLVDSHQGKVRERSFSSYALFVTFFPQLISGPIVHHAEMMSQFKKRRQFQHRLMAAGITFFILGLFKKVGIADELAWYVNQVFDHPELGQTARTTEVWLSSLAYTLQIYFDFSGYSDMAIGLGLMFGIFLPINFNSPLKSASIIDFWRRWHITLSRFLKEYLYIPLGGNRKGFALQLVFLMITMLLGGLWHGAAYTFVIWGVLHGVFLIVNHLYRTFARSALNEQWLISVWWQQTSWLMTFMAVVLAFVVFRVQDLEVLSEIFNLMFAVDTADGVADGILDQQQLLRLIILLAVLMLVVKAMPNTQQLMGYDGSQQTLQPASWKPSFITTALMFVLLTYSLIKIMTNGYTEFIYRFF